MKHAFGDTQANLGFVVNQTSHIEREVYETKYPEYNYAEFMPVDTSAHPFSKTVTYYSSDKAGAAKWMNGNSNDVPLVGLSQNQSETAVHTAGIGYDYGWEEVGQANMLGRNLSAEKAIAARTAYEQMVHRTAMLGDADKGFEGLFTFAGVAPVGAAGVYQAGGLSADAIIADINSQLTGIHADTNTVEMANSVVLPYTRFNYIASTRIPDTNMTILEFIKAYNVYTANTGQELFIRGSRHLEAGGAAVDARMVVYRRDPQVVKMHIPMPLQFLAPVPEVLNVVVPGVFRLGGADLRLPGAFRYVDGV